jgi:hypothetical protein
VIQAAIDALPTETNRRGYGIAFLKASIYDIASTVTLKHCTRLIGEGQQATILNMTGDANCLVVEDTDSFGAWEISNLSIDMNQKAGHAIYSAYPGHGESYLQKQKMSMLHIRNVKTGYMGVYMVDWREGEISHVTVQTYGNGFYFVNDAKYGLDYGDCFLFDLRAHVESGNGTGFTWRGNTSGNTMNLALISRLMIDGWGATGTGLLIQGGARMAFDYLDVEGFATGVSIEILDSTKSKTIDFFHPRITGATSYGFRCTYGTGEIHLYGGEIVGGTGCSYIYYDNENNLGLPNVIYGTGLMGTGAIQLGGGGVRHTLLHGVELGAASGKFSEQKGKATFSGNGSTTSFVIPHGLWAGYTPRYWNVVKASNITQDIEYVTADGTNLTVVFESAPPAGTNNVVLSWEAEV